MLSAILGTIGTNIVGSFFDRAADVFKSYLNKEISKQEAIARVQTAMLEATREVERSHADALAKTYASFMDALKTSRLMQVVWASVTISQLLVLLWHQIGIPAIVALGIVAKYPASGNTVDWAYALLAACLGLGPVVLRTGPAASGGVVGALKSLIGK